MENRVYYSHARLNAITEEPSMLTEEEWLDRLMIEGQNLKREQPTFRRVRGSWTHWRGEILGSGIYEGGVFVVDVIIPREYPFKPPRVRWRSEIWHPNIFKNNVCIGILGKDWTPVNSLVDLIESLRFLLTNPNPDDPLNTTAARQFKESPQLFVDRAKSYIERYATWDQAEKLDG